MPAVLDVRKLVRAHPKRCGGQLTVMDFRLPVKLIYEFVDAGYSPEEIAWLYPFLKREIVEELIARKEEIEALMHKREE